MIFITSEDITDLDSFAHYQRNDLPSLLSKGSIEKSETKKVKRKDGYILSRGRGGD
jgi:hypothetical protein